MQPLIIIYILGHIGRNKSRNLGETQSTLERQEYTMLKMKNISVMQKIIKVGR